MPKILDAQVRDTLDPRQYHYINTHYKIMKQSGKTIFSMIFLKLNII